MFDIYGIIDLEGRRRLSNVCDPFRNYKYYDFDYIEHSYVTDNATIFYLERKQDAENFSSKSGKHLFVFGFVFGNRRLCILNNIKFAKQLNAEDVLGLYERLGLDFVHYVKGSFVVVLYEERANRVLIISDHLNVLPVYYSYKSGMLAFSSAMKPIVDSSFVDASIDPVGVVEFSIFDYTLGDRTFYEEVKQVEYAQILTASSDGISQRRYFSISDLLQGKAHKREESLEMLSGILRDNSRLYVEDAGKFLLALTGGFDCRMNLALLDRRPEDFLCYSYGLPGSRQLEIPIQIAKRLRLNYVPIVLDEKFEKEFEDCALRALFYSDGTGPILRANYPYAFGRLNYFSDIAVTGLFGSEIMRPLRNMGIQINSNSERIFMDADFDRSLMTAFETEKKEGYINGDVLDASYGQIRDHLKSTYLSHYGRGDRLVNLYHYYIAEGVRKYFTQEIRIERTYVETRFPYFDFDFVKAIFSTPYAGLYNGALKESPVGRRNAQSLYASVIERYNPVLGQIQVDRGYRPTDLLSPVWFLKILPGYVKAKSYHRRRGDDTFDAPRWTDSIFSKQKELMKKKTDVFTDVLYYKYMNNANLRDNYRFSRMFSLKYWFEHDGA